MIVSVHLAEVGWRRAPGMLRQRPRLGDVPGLTYAEPVLGTPLRDGPVPRRLFPAFRDRDELPLSSDLGSTIEDVLMAEGSPGQIQSFPPLKHGKGIRNLHW